MYWDFIPWIPGHSLIAEFHGEIWRPDDDGEVEVIKKSDPWYRTRSLAYFTSDGLWGTDGAFTGVPVWRENKGSDIFFVKKLCSVRWFYPGYQPKSRWRSPEFIRIVDYFLTCASRNFFQITCLKSCTVGIFPQYSGVSIARPSNISRIYPRFYWYTTWLFVGIPRNISFTTFWLVTEIMCASRSISIEMLFSYNLFWIKGSYSFLMFLQRFCFCRSLLVSRVSLCRYKKTTCWWLSSIIQKI